jgi:hypothetical protein
MTVACMGATMTTDSQAPAQSESIVEQLEACALKAARQANIDADANSLDRAFRALEVCRKALELLPFAVSADLAKARKDTP